MKGQIPVLEMIAVLIVLFVSFGIFFPNTGFEDRWGDASVVLKGKDMMLTMDRLGLLDQYVANASALSGFLNRTIPEKDLIYWTTLDGTLQNKVTVACNCTTQQISDLSNYIGQMRLNGRDIQVDVVASSLSPIQQSDVLLIWGRTALGPYKTDILNYLASGRGVVGLADVASPDADYTQIFGVKRCQDIFSGGGCSGSPAGEDSFTPQTGVDRLTYQPYKLFFHLPMVSTGNLGIGLISGEGNVTPCPNFPIYQGSFNFKTTSAAWWVCNSTSVYVDTNNNNVPDRVVSAGQSFNVTDVGTGASFMLREAYVGLNSTILDRTYVSIKPGFKFDNFRPAAVSLYPADLDETKILLGDGTYNNGRTVPVAVANGTSNARVYWATDFLSDTAYPAHHDARLLIASLLLAASNKKDNSPPLSSIQIGYLTPYVNVVDRDMFEVYQFNLGLGYPF